MRTDDKIVSEAESAKTRPWVSGKLYRVHSGAYFHHAKLEHGVIPMGYYTAPENKQPIFIQNREVVMFLSDKYCYTKTKDWVVVLYGGRRYLSKKKFLIEIGEAE